MRVPWRYAMQQKKKYKAWQRGRMGECLALWLLRLKGYRILERNWRHKAGEIDLIARRGGFIIFIEVKTRATMAQAQFAISEQQWQRIARAAQAYVARRPHIQQLNWRYDCIFWAPYHLPQHKKNFWRFS